MTDEAIATILRAMRLGMSSVSASLIAGVGPAVMRNHKRRNAAFATAIKRASEEGKMKLLSKIHNADQWQSAAWLLERIWPDEFAKRDMIRVTSDPRVEAQKLAAAFEEIDRRTSGHANGTA